MLGIRKKGKEAKRRKSVRREKRKEGNRKRGKERTKKRGKREREEKGKEGKEGFVFNLQCSFSKSLYKSKLFVFCLKGN